MLYNISHPAKYFVEKYYIGMSNTLNNTIRMLREQHPFLYPYLCSFVQSMSVPLIRGEFIQRRPNNHSVASG